MIRRGSGCGSDDWDDRDAFRHDPPVAAGSVRAGRNPHAGDLFAFPLPTRFANEGIAHGQRRLVGLSEIPRVARRPTAMTPWPA